MARPRREKQDYMSQAATLFPHHQKRKGLLDLPAELWSKIGHLVIADKHPYTEENILKQLNKTSRRRNYQPPITRVCRVLREELLPLWFQEKVTICIHGHYDDNTIRFIGKWLKALPHTSRKLVAGALLLTSPHATIRLERCKEVKILLGVPMLFGSWRSQGFGRSACTRYVIEFRDGEDRFECDDFRLDRLDGLDDKRYERYGWWVGRASGIEGSAM